MSEEYAQNVCMCAQVCVCVCVRVCVSGCVCVFPRAKIGKFLFPITRPTRPLKGRRKSHREEVLLKKNNSEASAGGKGRKEGGRGGWKKRGGQEEETKTKWWREEGENRKDGRNRIHSERERQCGVTVCECAYWKGWVSGKTNNENAESLQPFHSNLSFCCSWFLFPRFSASSLG